LRPPLGTGYSLEDSARNWRSLRFRGLWDAYDRGPALARNLVTSYGTQMARLGEAARIDDPSLAIAALVKADRLPQDLYGRVTTRYALAQFLMSAPAENAQQRDRLLAAAEASLAKITAEAPGFWRAYLLLGNLAFLRGDKAAARRALETALSALPTAGAEAERARVERLLRGL
jgi:tetratricopeptide (TPR) repeat protein